MTTEQILLGFAAPAEYLTLNQRLHWWERAARTEAWRTAAALHARNAARQDGIGTPLPSCDLRFVFSVKGNRRRDPHNWVATVKPIVDGLVDAGWWPDDTPDHLSTTEPRLHVKTSSSQRPQLDVMVIATPRDPQAHLRRVKHRDLRTASFTFLQPCPLTLDHEQACVLWRNFAALHAEHALLELGGWDADSASVSVTFETPLTPADARPAHVSATAQLIVDGMRDAGWFASCADVVQVSTPSVDDRRAGTPGPRMVTVTVTERPPSTIGLRR